MIPTRSKRLLVALAFIVFAVTACAGSSPAISAGSAPASPPAQAAPQADPGEVDSATSGRTFGSQFLAAIQAAEEQPHGDIGDPAEGQVP